MARVGGDELTVPCSGHDPVLVKAVADRLCQRTWRFGPLTPARLFAAADRAQYVAKHGRLSSTVMADPIR